MNLKFNFIIFLIISVFLLFSGGCQTPEDVKALEKPEDINAPIGALSDIFQTGATEVRGFGIVNGLAGTGSSQCDPVLKNRLVKYIKVMMVDRESLDPEKFIASLDTAVVEVYGVIPALAARGDFFDLRVAPIRNTQTTSLEGGRLYTTILVGHDTIFTYDQYSKPLAYADGQIFIDKSSKQYDLKKGYVFAGGKVAHDVKIDIILKEENFFTASTIRNSINERFGSNTAMAKSPKEITINIPEKYHYDKIRFLDMLRTMHIGENPADRIKRIDKLVYDLAVSENKYTPEITLETLGNPAVEKMSGLLSHPDEKIRFHAARCILNIGSDISLQTLRRIVETPASTNRIDAIKALGVSAKRKDAISILGDVTGDEDFEAAYAAYEVLRKLEDISVTTKVVATDFFVDNVYTKGPQRIFVSRQSFPRIVIFGNSVTCDRNLFVQDEDGKIIINASPNDKYISVSRQHPTKPNMIGPLQSTFQVSDLVRTMGEMPRVPRETLRRPGLSIPYYDIIRMLKKMCSTGAIDAEYIEGPLAEFPLLQNRIENLKNPDQTNTPGILIPVPKDSSKPKKEDDSKPSRREWELLLENRSKGSS